MSAPVPSVSDRPTTRGVAPIRPSTAERLALVAAPALMLVGSGVHPAESADAGRQLDIVASSASRWTLAHVLLIAGALAMLAAVPALGRLLRPSGAGTVSSGTALAVAGAGALVGVFALEGLAASALADLPDRGAAATAFATLVDAALPLALLSLGLAVGLGLLGVAGVRAGRGRTGAALALGGLLLAVGLLVEVGALAAACLALVTAGLVGIAWSEQR